MATAVAPAPRARAKGKPLLEIKNLSQTYAKAAADDLLVLEGVDLTVRDGEIVGLLGRSGVGKSSLLRIIAGLTRPKSGEVRWRGRPLAGPSEGIAMVFQSFALFPWLTVLENVELGLEALGLGDCVGHGATLAAHGGRCHDRGMPARHAISRR